VEEFCTKDRKPTKQNREKLTPGRRFELKNFMVDLEIYII